MLAIKLWFWVDELLGDRKGSSPLDCNDLEACCPPPRQWRPAGVPPLAPLVVPLFEEVVSACGG